VSTWSVVALRAPRQAAVLSSLVQAVDTAAEWLVISAPFDVDAGLLLRLGDEVIAHAGQTAADVYRFVAIKGGRVTTELFWGLEAGWAVKRADHATRTLIDRIAREEADRLEDLPVDGELSRAAIAALCAMHGLDMNAAPTGRLRKPRSLLARLFRPAQR
jgi:hypothetical protein